MISKPNLCNMKQGWEIKKLGDVCDILNGLWIGKKEPFVNICVIRNTNFTKDCKLNLDNVAYIDAEEKQFITRKLLKGDIIIEKSGGSEKQPVGRVVLFNVVEGDYSFSNFTSVLRINQNNKLDPGFLHKCLYAYYLRGETLKLQSKTTGLHNLDMKGYLRLNIPIPPLAEQERIVAELDCLSGVIEIKKQQLKELDALAQSIFYEMFGDPITNEKGWEVKKLGEVSTLLNGRAYKQKELLNDGKYKVLRVGNFFTNDSYYYSDLELENNKYCDNGDLLFAWSASFGAFIWKGDKVIYHYHIWKVLYDCKVLNIEYYRYLLNTMTHSFMNDVHGIGMVHLTKSGMEQYSLPLPPLPLQQAFASKIEAIEKQKELIKKSIEETETLFNSRMDYYFS